jgi:tRNA(His) guanylyltransferase
VKSNVQGDDLTDALGDRMKDYESRESGRRFLPMLPVYARIDGRNFSVFTRGMERPFDPAMTEIMLRTTEKLVEATHARIGYTQSDEISLVWQSERPDSSIFFDHRIAKMTSVLASLATSAFIVALLDTPHAYRLRTLPHFDCRVFQLPSRSEAANVFLWREQDATKNAISMAARSVYSHKELDHKNGPQMQEMLFSKGINFNDYPAFFKRGTFVRRVTMLREFTAKEIAGIPESHRPEPGAKVERSEIRRLDMPRFGSVANREAVIFDGADPAMVE